MQGPECPGCGAKNVYIDELHDARGIYCGSGCPKCLKELKRHFRPEIFTNSQYECDEQIEPD